MSSDPRAAASSRPDGAGSGPAGNYYDKYNTKNPLYRILVRSFLQTVRSFAHRLERPSVLEVGCGEGHLARYLSDGWIAERFVAFDISLPVIATAASLGGEPAFFVGDSVTLPFTDKSFDLVVMCEVMEHLAAPERALAEISRVARERCLVSVPREPLWRILNVARGAYWRDLGNTPGHVQWWSRSSFLKLVRGYGTVRAAAAPFPWTVAMFEPFAG